jgi:hypothetical protein
MPKVIQIPRRIQRETQDRVLDKLILLPNSFEESESLAKIHRWLGMADWKSAKKSAPGKKRSA